MNPVTSTAPLPIPDSTQLRYADSFEITPLLPPRKTELPYTANEYRLLPDDQKSATLSFLLEAKTTAEFFESLHLDTTEIENKIDSANKEIIEWCVTNDEPETLEFFFEKNPAVNFLIDAEWPSDKLISVANKLLDIHPKLAIDLVSISFEPSIYPFLCNLISDSRVVKLEMDASNASETDLLQFMKAMSNSLSASDVYIEGLNMTEKTEQAFAFVLAGHLPLSKLQIKDSDFGPAGGANILNALANNKSLQKLTLENVAFATGYQHGLGYMLEKNNTLIQLGASCQNFGSDGIKNILKGGQKNTSLQTLVLVAEENQPDNALELTKFVALNKPITALMVTCNPLSDDEKINLLGAMDKNKFLCELEWFTEDNREAYEKDAISQLIFRVLKGNSDVRDNAILNQTSRSFSDKPFDSLAYLPEGPAQMIIDNLWQLSDSKVAFEATAAELSLTLNEVAKQEEARKKEIRQRASQDSSNTSSTTDSSSSSSSAVRKDS